MTEEKMGVLSGFADEISPELDEQLATLKSLNMRFLELRGVWGTNVLDLNDKQLAQVKKRLAEEGIGVSAIGSPIGKVKITDDFEAHLKRFNHALDLAEYFNSRYIRIFSYFIPEGDNPAQYRDEVMNRMKEKTRLAEKRNIILLHENEKHIYGDTGARNKDILETVNSPNLRAIYDPANYVQNGQKPFTECYPLVKDYIEYLHIKDAKLADGKVTPAGEGDGQVPELIAALHKKGFNGFLSMEPHLSKAGRFDGFSGPQLFSEAVKALRKILDEIVEN